MFLINLLFRPFKLIHSFDFQIKMNRISLFCYDKLDKSTKTLPVKIF